MSIFHSMNTTASALTAQRLRWMSFHPIWQMRIQQELNW